VYNELLNNQCISNFKNDVAGKRILLVGNAVSLFSDDKHGEVIDSYDHVVRFGKGLPKAEHSAYVGTKFDTWFAGPGRASMFKQVPKTVKHHIYTPSQVRMYENEELLVAIREMFDGRYQVYRDFFMSGTTTDIVRFNKSINGAQHQKARLSQGVQCIEFFTRIGLEFTLIGFDFFGGEFTYTFDNGNHKHIPAEQPTTSWHCPLRSKDYTENPHGFSEDGQISNEERYIRSLQNVKVIPMPPVDPEKAEQLAKSLRGENSIMKKEMAV